MVIYQTMRFESFCVIDIFVWLILCYFVHRTMNRLTQLERLDLGSNEFTEVVSPRVSQAMSPAFD